MTTPRREFLRHAALIGNAAVTVPLEALWRPTTLDTDRLRPVSDESTGLPLLQLPEGFRYRSFGWMGDVLDSGLRTPGAHDGMAAFPGPDGTVVLIRNHELLPAKAFDSAIAYDAEAGGGTGARHPESVDPPDLRSLGATAGHSARPGHQNAT